MDRSKFGFYVLCAFVFLFAITIIGVNSTYSINEGNAYKWDVSFSSVDASSDTISDYVIPKVDGESTSLTDFKFKVDSPGDNIVYKINVINQGSIDAKIGQLYVDYACSNDDLCKDLDYSLTYEDGSLLKRGDIINTNSGKTIYLKFNYNGTINEELVIDNVKLFVNYIER